MSEHIFRAIEMFGPTALDIAIDTAPEGALNAFNADGLTPLLYALQRMKFIHARVLIEAGADVNKPSKDGIYPVEDVIYYGRDDLLQLMVDRGLDANQPIRYGFAPLLFVIIGSLPVRRPFVPSLVTVPPPPLTGSMFPSLMGSGLGSGLGSGSGLPPLSSLGLGSGSGLPPLSGLGSGLGSRLPPLSGLGSGLDSRIYMDTKQYYPLSGAPVSDLLTVTNDAQRRAITNAWNRNLETAKILVSGGADIFVINRQGESLLNIAKAYNPSIEEYFTELMANNPNESMGVTYFMQAAANGRIDQLSVYLRNLKNINDQDKAGNTALIHAVSNSQDKAVKFLLDHGADPFIENNSGNVALDYAKQEKILNLLRQAVSKEHSAKLIQEKFIEYEFTPGVYKPTVPGAWALESTVNLPPEYAREYYGKCDETRFPNITRDEIYNLALQLGLEPRDIDGLTKEQICQKMTYYLSLMSQK